MALIDISGPVYSGMWYYGEPHMDLPVGGVDIHQVEMPEQYGQLIMDYVSMCSQTGTYLETAAHAIARTRDDRAGSARARLDGPDRRDPTRRRASVRR